MNIFNNYKYRKSRTIILSNQILVVIMNKNVRQDALESNCIKDNKVANYINNNDNPEYLLSYLANPVSCIFIFDYDDTLFPSWFFRNKDRRHDKDILTEQNEKDEKNDQDDIEELQRIIYALLTSAHDKGIVYIITNAESAWVYKSVEKYFPKLKSVIRRTKVISARDVYRDQRTIVSREQLKMWKFKAIRNHVLKTAKRLHSTDNCSVQVISIGDSNIEIDATTDAIEKIPWCICKTVKLSEQPSINILKCQLQLLSTVLDSVIQHDKELVLEMKLQNAK